MNSTAYRAALMSLVLVLSSLAGCLGGEEEEDPTIMVSTYHVGELVSAVVGDTLTVEVISPSNVPVHDYEPSAADIVRLSDSDLFFYHGLNLEPWVDTTIESLGEDAPLSVMTHTMPTGQDTLDYESVLISNLCEVLTEGPFESTTLGTMSDDHDDDHDDHDDDHDDHSDEEGDHDDDHDDHSDEEGDHDEHDDDGEEMTPETALQYFDTNGDESLSWDEFWVSWEEGEDDDHDDDHDDEHEVEMSALMEIFNESDANMDGLLDINELEHFIHEIMELEEGHHDGHAHAEAEETIENPTGCPTDTVISIFHMEEGEYVLEFESEHDEDFNMASLKMPGGHAHHDHGHGSGPFEWAGIFSITDVSHTWTMEKVDGSYADPSMRVVLIPTDTPTEETMHSLEDGVEALIEGDTCTIIEDGESMTPVDGGSCFEWHVGTGDISTFTIDTTGISGFAAYTAHSPYEFEATQHYLKDSTGNDVEHVAEEGGGGHGDHGDHGDDHGDEHGDEMCHNTETHENYESTEEECEAAGHVWMEDGHDDHHGVCHDASTHENHEEYETEEDCVAAGHMWMEEENHDLPEIHADFVAHTLSFPEDDHDDHSDEEGDHDDDHDDHSDEEGHHEVGYVVIHIEEEGDYGFALPTDVEFFVLMGEGDHGHDDHDDHDDHSDEEDDHSDEEDDHSDEEIEFDPHSWLSPLAFKAQVDLVLEVLNQQYPEHEDTFNDNAEAFKVELDSMHMKYNAISDECEQRTVVANHNAYSYIGLLYDIRFVTVHGLDPEGEPSAADIAEVLEQIEEDGLTVLFVEEYTNPNAVAGIVDQTKSGTMPDGIDIQVLYTMELPPMDSEDNYLSLMEKNLDSLKAGMGC